ncbi:NADH-quinone oxidoreductase subunit B [Actinomadura fibrosa]|uniref:NADH-quinone oxidoreductase subunit B n=1 Tax=Actinomadura fibrosa TaxID=111802 RepID=UPI0010411770|nr:NADH-quinone oxidoreductase subunit NuoB [Actinomadura fibrosa]
MSTIDLPPPSVGPLSRLAPKPIKFVLNWGRRYSLWVFNFGLACCAIEFIATSMSRHDFIRLGVIPFAPGPRQADLMVVSGTVSDKMAPAVRRLYEQMPEPKYVISFGACSNCGGPYWDSYCVTKGVDQIIPVDVYVPGCPPRPEALLHGIVHLQEKIAAESLGDRYNGGDAVSPPPAPRPLSATVLRRPLQPPPALDEAPDPEDGPAASPEATAPLEDAAPPAETGPPAEESASRTVPLDEAATPEAPGATDPTQPVPAPESEAPPAHPADDATLPVPPVEGAPPDETEEQPPTARGTTRPLRPADDTRPVRRVRDHDPSIIPGLADDADGGDGDGDEIGRHR